MEEWGDAQDVGEWGRGQWECLTQSDLKRHYLWLLARREKKTLWRISLHKEEEEEGAGELTGPQSEEGNAATI